MKRQILTLVVVGLALGAAGCSSARPESPGTPSASPSASYPVTVGTLTLDKRPERVISLAPTATEMLFAVGAGKQVVAVDEFSTYPTDAPRTKLSGYKPNAEAISAERPDLVVLSDDRDKIVANLKALKIPVFLTPAASTLDDTYREITDIGTLTGHPKEAADVVSGMRADIAAALKDLPARAKALTYFYELDPGLFTVTSQTFIGSLLGQAGLVNIADSAGAKDAYPQLSAEVVLKAGPDLIFLADTGAYGGQTAATVSARAGWANVPAVKNHHVVELDADIASRWGPRVVDLLRAVAKAAGEVPA